MIRLNHKKNMTTLKLTKEHFEELMKRGYTLDQLFVLMLVKEGNDMEALCTNSMKMDALHQSLIRKGLLSSEGKVTLQGNDLLDFLNTKVVSSITKKKQSSSDFDEWWESFPSTDHFEYKGRVFTGSRGMRVKKENCRLKFNAILNEGKYTGKQIIEATKYVVTMKKELSLTKKSNELTYLTNSYTFLNDGQFEPFIELITKGVRIEPEAKASGSTDV